MSDRAVMVTRAGVAFAIGLVAFAIAWERPGTAMVWLAAAWMIWP